MNNVKQNNKLGGYSNISVDSRGTSLISERLEHAINNRNETYIA